MSTFPDKFRLDGRTALVTGSARGLGWEMAKGLAEAGALILLHGRSQQPAHAPAGRVARRWSARPRRWPSRWPIGLRWPPGGGVATAEQIDILVHKCRRARPAPFAEIQPDDFARLVDTDLSAGQALIHHLLPGMVERGWGRLILVSSIAADLAAPGASSYIAAKAGLAALAPGPCLKVRCQGHHVHRAFTGLLCDRDQRGVDRFDGRQAVARPLPSQTLGRAVGHCRRRRLPGVACRVLRQRSRTLTVDGGVSATCIA